MYNKDVSERELESVYSIRLAMRQLEFHVEELRKKGYTVEIDDTLYKQDVRIQTPKPVEL